MNQNTDKLLKEILEELRHIRDDLGIVQGDLNAIRNGEYDAPHGVDRTPPITQKRSSEEPQLKRVRDY